MGLPLEVAANTEPDSIGAIVTDFAADIVGFDRSAFQEASQSVAGASWRVAEAVAQHWTVLDPRLADIVRAKYWKLTGMIDDLIARPNDDSVLAADNEQSGQFMDLFDRVYALLRADNAGDLPQPGAVEYLLRQQVQTVDNAITTQQQINARMGEIVLEA